jgi:hypothetical protein
VMVALGFPEFPAATLLPLALEKWY